MKLKLNGEKICIQSKSFSLVSCRKGFFAFIFWFFFSNGICEQIISFNGTSGQVL